MIELSTTTAYTVDEVSKKLHKTRDTILRYIKKGQLRAQKVGRPYYITERALEEFITGEKPPRA